MKKYWIGFILAAILAAAAIWWFRRATTLAELQKQYLLAQTDAEKAKVVDRLERYYLNLSIPDSIRQRVDKEVAMQLDTTKINSAAVTPDTNVYRLESQLQSVLQKAAIARARDENDAFQTLIGQAKNLAQTVDTGTQNQYWAPFVNEVGGFMKEQAVSWLKAKRAEWLAWFYGNNDSTFIDAEKYAALGLKLLQRVNDERVRLDIVQRLQWILHRYHWMHELSIALAQKALPQAEKINHLLRANALHWVEAEARSKMGQPQAALALYDTVVYNAIKFRQIDRMQWFADNGLLGRVNAYIDLGEFEEASNICHELERLNWGQSNEAMLLEFLKFNILYRTAHYKQAEEALKKAMALAETLKSTANRIVCLNNFGTLHNLLTEYDVALEYFNQAKSLFTTNSPTLGLRLLIFTNIAYSLIAENDSAQFKQIITEAEDCLRLVYSPYMEAYLLFRIGDWHQKVKKYRAAIQYYHKADSVSYQSGFLHLALDIRIERVKCLIALSRFSEAKALIAEIEPLAKSINDIERLIDAHDGAARIHYLEGDIAQAIESAKVLLHEIEEMSSRFNNPGRLIAYRQKIYEYLKHAVLYEIALQHQDVAFAKLDQAKAYVLKSQLFNGYADHYRQQANGNHRTFVRTKLDQKSLLLDYMITPDTLYAFVVDREGMQLLRKKFDMEALRRMTSAYRDSINHTPRCFQHYNAQQAQAHYAGTVALGQQLYQELLGWPEIEARLPQTELLYIVPDEFLYEIPFSTLMANRSDVQTFLVNHTAALTLPSAGTLANENQAEGAYAQRTTPKVLMSVDRQFPGAEQFVAKVQTLFPLAEELTVPAGAFTKDAVLAQLQKDYQIYIFLGHGQANPQYPDYGYIELSVKTPKTSTAKIMRLTVADLKAINWARAEMVMLVGCETAGGRLYRGTGIAGLQRELLSLGAKNVLGNLWEVHAIHAIAQAQDFLTAWVTTRNPSRALQASQRQAVQTLRGHRYYQQPHPYFWGSTVLLTAALQ